MDKKTKTTTFMDIALEKARRRARIKNDFPKARKRRKYRLIKQKRILKAIRETERKREMQRQCQ